MRRNLLLIGLVCCFALLLLATSTPYSQPFAASHGWTYIQISCTGGGTCTNGDVADGNPTPGVFAKVAVKSKVMVGYFSHTYTWQNLGVPAGEVVSTVNGSWDDKAVQTVSACTSSSTMGMQIFDSANTTECTASAVEPNLNVAGDTAAWTNHNPTGVINVNAGCSASTTTITLRLNINPASGATTGSACELRGDNYALTIVSATPPAGVKRKTVVLIY